MADAYELMICAQTTSMRPIEREAQPFLYAHLEEKRNGGARAQSESAYEALFRLWEGSARVTSLPRILYEDSGRPVFEMGTPFFSLSHTVGASIACLSHLHRVGVDIESLREAIEKQKGDAYRALARRMFFAEELEALPLSASDEVFLRDFLSMYTKKEALAKLLTVPVMQVHTMHIPPNVRIHTEIAKEGDFLYTVALRTDSPFVTD